MLQQLMIAEEVGEMIRIEHGDDYKWQPTQ